MPTNTAKNRIGQYIDNGNGTVSDTHTGLTWMRCVLGQIWDGTACTGEAGEHRFNRAMALRITFADCSDWRLPNIDELESIVDPNRTNPSINKDAFPNTPYEGAFLRPSFWSSSVSSSSKDYRQTIYFDSGGVGASKYDDSHHVRLVRGEAFFAKNSLIEGGDASASTINSLTPSTSDQQREITSLVETLMKRVDRMESRFDAIIEKMEKAVKTISSGQLAATKHITNKVDLRVDESIRVITTTLSETRRLGVHELLLQPSVPATDGPVLSPTSVSTVTGVGDFAALLTQLVEMETISLADLRMLILPLGLMPNAVIDEINERALDLFGEPALKEDEDEIIVFQDVLVEVIARWNLHKEWAP